jgi:eukaryotic-like serine/threonine-protein kinase
MSVSSSCPPASRLRQLLSGHAADEAELTTHLDWCETCRQKLEAFAGDSSLLDAAQRSGDSYMDEVSLRRVLHVLAGDRDLTTIHRPRDEMSRSTLPARLPEMPHQLGGCEVTRVLGQGGMGLVYQAFDPALKRWVAIKVLSPHLSGESLARLRFAREAQAAAAVCHENVITIHAVSEINGLPYFVMEYLSGGSLQDILDRHGRLTWQVVARIGAEVASGLAAAHDRGLIHRDIKPSNVLLQATDDARTPGIAKIGDFGLARVADDSRLTRTGQIAGTPMYMSPEQSLGEPLDHRADLFSLGSVLYSLCTGRDPFPGGTPVVVLRQVCELTPTPVRRVNPDIPVWLAAVVERLQAKRPADRLSSAAEVADILRFNLKHPESPRMVPPPRASGRMHRHKHRLLVGAALACLLLPGGLMLSGSAFRDTAPATSQPAADLAHRVSRRATLQGHNGPVWSVSFSPDGRILATGSDDTTLRFWDVATGSELAVLSGHRSAVFAAAFAHSGEFLASGSGDGTIRIWDVATRKERTTLPHGAGSVRRIAISPDDKTVAVGSNTRDVELWDLKDRTIRQSLTGHHGTILAIAFAADGKTLATGDARGNIRFWDPTTGAEREGFAGDQLSLRALAFSPDRQTLASAGGKDVKLWRVATRQRFATLSGLENGLVCLAFSTDGAYVAAGSREGNVTIWDVRSTRVRASFEAHRGLVYSLAFGPDGRTLASVGEDGMGRLWDLGSLRETQP